MWLEFVAHEVLMYFVRTEAGRQIRVWRKQKTRRGASPCQFSCRHVRKD